MEHTPAPKKSRELFYSSTQGCALQKSGSYKKQFTLQQSLPLFEVEWSKAIKFNYICMLLKEILSQFWAYELKTYLFCQYNCSYLSIHP